jgi:hypothetical protein
MLLLHSFYGSMREIVMGYVNSKTLLGVR